MLMVANGGGSFGVPQKKLNCVCLCEGKRTKEKTKATCRFLRKYPEISRTQKILRYCRESLFGFLFSWLWRVGIGNLVLVWLGVL